MCRGYLLRRQKTQTCIHVFLFAIPAELTKNCIQVVKYQIMQSFLQQHCILTIQGHPQYDIVNTLKKHIGKDEYNQYESLRQRIEWVCL
ncbi:Uncharacterised protein [Escherichia coli]|nr:Uncharacterised protein [Escherichia coli]